VNQSCCHNTWCTTYLSIGSRIRSCIEQQCSFTVGDQTPVLHGTGSKIRNGNHVQLINLVLNPASSRIQTTSQRSYQKSSTPATICCCASIGTSRRDRYLVVKEILIPSKRLLGSLQCKATLLLLADCRVNTNWFALQCQRERESVCVCVCVCVCVQVSQQHCST
jgi:hypothetical protein